MEFELMSSIEKINGCQIEWDRVRGVVYVHGPDGRTLIRISKLPDQAMNRLHSLTRGALEVTAKGSATAYTEPK